jgi:CBS domain-containing protein
MTDSTLLDPARLAPDANNPSVGELMRPEVVFCLPSTPLDAVAKLMADNDLTEIPVLIDRRPVGYVVSRDIVAQYVAGRVELTGSDLVRQTFVLAHAGDVLHAAPLLVDRAEPMRDVVTAMHRQGHTTALVMYDDEHPVGMVSVREVAAFAASTAGARAGPATVRAATENGDV